MKTPRISEAIGNLPEDLVSDAVTYKRTNKKKAFIKWGSIAACFMVMVMAATLIIPMLNDSKPSEMGDIYLPAHPDEIIWASNNQSNESPDNANAFVEWNGWSIDYSLYEAINRAEATDYIAVVVRKNNSVDRNSFEYNGTTYGELRAERERLFDLREKYFDFPKMSEWLKYGELLYTTGTPDGEKWTKELYDETVAYYGKDFIAKYIVDGELAFELLNEDLLACERRIGELSNEMVELDEVYHKSYVDDVKKNFERADACTVVQNGFVFLFVQKNELATLKIKGKNDYTLSLATRTAFDGSNEDVPNHTIDETVTGFDLNKIGLSNVDGCRTGAITSEEDLYAALNDLISHWENLMITIGSDNPIDQTELEEMNYSEVQHWKYPTRTVVFVNRNNLNIEALKELTLREDISFVWVSEQLVPTDDNADVGPTPDGD